MEFGLTKRATVVEEKYPNNAIITLPGYTEGEGANTKITFNKKAYEILGLIEDEENEIAFSTSKSEMNKTFLINANAYDSHANVKLRKNGTYANKTNFKILKNRFHCPLENELLLEIVKTSRIFDGQTIFVLEEFKEQTQEELTSQQENL